MQQLLANVVNEDEHHWRLGENVFQKISQHSVPNETTFCVPFYGVSVTSYLDQ